MESFTISAKLVSNVIAFVGLKSKRKTQSLSCDKLQSKLQMWSPLLRDHLPEAATFSGPLAQITMEMNLY